MSMPKCKVCGRFLNPRTPNIESDIISSMFEISHYEYWHVKCQKNKSDKLTKPAQGVTLD